MNWNVYEASDENCPWHINENRLIHPSITLSAETVLPYFSRNVVTCALGLRINLSLGILGSWLCIDFFFWIHFSDVFQFCWFLHHDPPLWGMCCREDARLKLDFWRCRWFSGFVGQTYIWMAQIESNQFELKFTFKLFALFFSPFAHFDKESQKNNASLRLSLDLSFFPFLSPVRVIYLNRATSLSLY